MFVVAQRVTYIRAHISADDMNLPDSFKGLYAQCPDLKELLPLQDEAVLNIQEDFNKLKKLYSADFQFLESWYETRVKYVGMLCISVLSYIFAYSAYKYTTSLVYFFCIGFLCEGGGLAFLCDYSKTLEPVAFKLIGKGSDFFLRFERELGDGCPALDPVRLERLKDKVSRIDRSIETHRSQKRLFMQGSAIDGFLKIRQHFQSIIDRHSLVV